MKKHAMNNALHFVQIAKTILLAVTLSTFSYQELRAQAISQAGEMNAMITQLVKSPDFPNEKVVAKMAEQISAAHGKQAAVERLVDYLREQPVDVDGIYAVRLIGSHIGEEFATTLAQAAITTDNATSRARFLLALRNSNASVIPSLIPFLQDTRIADPTKKQRSEEPGVYRVCDIAHNVIAEIVADRKADAPKIRRSDDIKSRDSAIQSLSKSLASPKAP